MKEKFQVSLAWFLFLMPIVLFSQTSLNFDDYFIDKTMRVDYFHTGDATEDIITIDKIYQQEVWAGNPRNLIDQFNNGYYYVKVYDVASNMLIYSKGFASIFNEFQTTNPALDGEKRTYHDSILLPFPKKPVMLVVECRDKKNVLHPICTYKIEPAASCIIKEDTRKDVKVYEALKNGEPHSKVDLAWIAEG